MKIALRRDLDGCLWIWKADAGMAMADSVNVDTTFTLVDASQGEVFSDWEPGMGMTDEMTGSGWVN